MKLAGSIFGQTELALRSGSVLAFGIYVAAIAALVHRVRWPFRFLGLSIALLNPYVLDFFSLARGYALAMAFVASSAAFAVSYSERPRSGAALGAVGCAALAVLANFTSVLYFGAVILVIVLGLVASRSRLDRRTASVALGSTAVLTITVAALAGIPLTRLRSAGELYVGGDDGFWRDTVRTLVESTLFRRGPDALVVALVLLIAAAIVAGAVVTVLEVRRGRLSGQVTAFVLLAIPAVASVVLHLLFDTLFAIERTALVFVPLFAIWLALAADALARRRSFSRVAAVGAVAVSLAAFLNFVSVANVSYVLDWRYDADTERIAHDLEEVTARNHRARVGASWLLEPTLNYYRVSQDLALPEITDDCRADCLLADYDWYVAVGIDPGLAPGERGGVVVERYRTSDGVLLHVSRSARALSR
jgi:hypothetical protein